MKHILVVACALATAAQAVLQMSMQLQKTSKHPVGRHFLEARADEALGLTLDNYLSYYQVEIELGTPGQKTVYTIDTGSSDLWAMSPENPFCSTNAQKILNGEAVNCTGPQSFNYKKSSTFHQNSSAPDFFISYGDSTAAAGYWGQDVVSIGGQELKDASFAVATKSNVSIAVFGIGLRDTESTVSNSNGYVYDNIPILLKKAGYIESVSYSMWLNDIDASQGSLLFGGVDHAKYKGTLGLVPMVPLNPNEPTLSSNDPGRLAIMLHGMSLYDSSGKSEQFVKCSLSVLIDSGTSLAYLPSDFIDAIGRSINAQYSQQIGYISHCNIEGGLTFDFSGVEIKVPFSQFMLQLSDDSTGKPATDSSGREVCALGFMPSNSDFILGDVFMRGAYIAFDLDNYQIALADANYNVTSSSIETISSGIPSASSAPGYSSTQISSGYDVQVVSNFQSEYKGESASLGGVQGSGSFAGNTGLPSGGPGGGGESGFFGTADSTATGTGGSGSESSSRKNNGRMIMPSVAALLAGSLLILI